MREIKFRGKRTDNDEWAYGYYAVHKMMLTGEMDYFIIVDEQRPQSVNPETLGQYTGLCDKNGKEIYEGDIVKSKRSHIAAVEWDEENGRYLAFTATRRIMYVGQEPAVEIIGNIHDDSHLLGGDKDIHAAK